MTILTCIQEATAVIGLNVPLSVFGATDRELVELQYVANNMAQVIARAYDWQALKKIGTVTGDGATQDFNLTTIASDYGRQLQKATMWVTSRPYYPLMHVTDSDDWLGIVTSNLQTTTGMWTIYGGQIHITPALANADTAKFFYITDSIVQPASGSNKPAFTLDTDTFLLSERVLRLGIIWQWKANKGLPYAEDMANYEIAIQETIARDKGSKIITVGRQRWSNSTGEFAWPGVLGS